MKFRIAIYHIDEPAETYTVEAGSHQEVAQEIAGLPDGTIVTVEGAAIVDIRYQVQAGQARELAHYITSPRPESQYCEAVEILIGSEYDDADLMTATEAARHLLVSLADIAQKLDRGTFATIVDTEEPNPTRRRRLLRKEVEAYQRRTEQAMEDADELTDRGRHDPAEQ